MFMAEFSISVCFWHGELKKKPFPASLSVYIDMCQKEACLDTIMQLAEKLS